MEIDNARSMRAHAVAAVFAEANKKLADLLPEHKQKVSALTALARAEQAAMHAAFVAPVKR